MTMTPAASQLKRNITLLDVIMLGAGSAIGAAIFTVLSPAAAVGGAAMLVTLLLAALPMGLFALVYAFLSSAMPMTAASYEWQRQFTHPAFAFAIVWLRVLSNAVVMVLLARVLLSYLRMVVVVPELPAIVGLLLVIFLLNYVGVRIAARAQTLLMIGLLAIFGLFIVAGAPQWQPQVLVDAVTAGWLATLAPLPLMIQLFLSIETATEVGGEVKNAERNIPLGLGLALLLTTLVYGLIAFTTLSLLGPQRTAASSAPLLEAANLSLGVWAKPLIVTAAVLALLKSMNAVFLVYSRFLYAMGTSGVLPASLARLHPRFATPHIATIVALVVSALCLLLPDSLIFLLLAVSLPTMGKYFGSCAAAYTVAVRHPDICSRARLRFSRTFVKWLAIAGALTALAIALVGITSDLRPYVLMMLWLGLGFVYYFWNRKHRLRLSPYAESSTSPGPVAARRLP